jgi:hypothetical protein
MSDGEENIKQEVKVSREQKTSTNMQSQTSKFFEGSENDLILMQ